jgi:hypothetical protein
VITNVLEKKKQTREDYQEQQEQKQKLINLIDGNQVLMADEELNGFSAEEVMEAAKYTLKANAFGVNVSKMDIKDSPIYYNQRTGKSRWFRKRKKINEAAAAMIQKARNIAAANERRANKQRVVFARMGQQVDQMVLNENITRIDENAFHDDPGYVESLEKAQAKTCFDQIETETNAFDTIGDVMKEAQKAKRTTWMGGKDKPKDEEVIKRKLDEIDTAIDKQLPGADALKEQILDIAKKKALDKLKSSYRYFDENITEEKIDQKIAAVKEKYVKEANKLIVKINSLYREVAEGKLSPEVLKIFLRTELMAHSTDTEKKIYRSLVRRNEDLPKPSPWDEQDYKDKLMELAKARREEGKCPPAEFQEYGGATKYLHKVGQPVLTDDLNELEEQAIQHTRTFLHFHPKIANPTILSRFYVTAKPGKQVDLMQAWMRTMASHKELAEKIYFKISGELNENRKDNIVVYVTENNKEAEVKQFLDAFYKECGGKEGDILESDKEALQGTVKNEDQNGITSSPEFCTSKIHDAIIEYGLFTDVKLDKALYVSRHTSAYSSVTKPKKVSYNEYLAKALFYSAEILSKKKGIPRDKIMENIKSDPGLKKQYMKYFADFIRLGDVDVGTMKRIGK